MIYITLQKDDDSKSYAFVNYGAPVICISENLKTWAEDEMLLSPDRFARRVAGVISHESIHIVLDELLDDGFKASSTLDKFFGDICREDDSTHGLWELEVVFREYGAK